VSSHADAIIISVVTIMAGDELVIAGALKR